MNLQQILNYLSPRTIFFILVIGVPVIRGIVKFLKEQKAQRDALERRRMAQSEELRTGRPAPSDVQAGVAAPVTAEQRLNELAARRKLLIEQARARAAASGTRRAKPIGGQTQSNAPQRPMQHVQLPGGLVLEIPIEPDAPARPHQEPPRQPQATNPPRAQPQRKSSRNRTSRPQTPAETPRGSRPLSAEGVRRSSSESAPSQRRGVSASVDPVHPQAPDMYNTPRVRKGNPSFFQRMSGNDWRKAMILREILQPPVSMRE